MSTNDSTLSPTPLMNDQDALRRARERIATTHPCRWGADPLVTAVQRGQVFKALRVLDRWQETQGIHPVDAILQPDATGRNLMHVAIAYSHPHVLAALETRAGTRVAPVTHDGQTLGLLALAIERHVHHRRYNCRQLSMVTYLLDRGESPVEGTAPQPWINLLVTGRHYAVLDRLIEHPAARGWRWDVPIVNKDPESVLVSLWGDGRLDKALVAGAPLEPQGAMQGVLHAMAAHGKTKEFNALRREHPHLLDTLNHDGETPIHQLVKAVLFGPGRWARRVHAFHEALDGLSPVHINQPDRDGYTPLMLLVSMSMNRLSIAPAQVKDLVGLMRHAGARLIPSDPAAMDVRTLLFGARTLRTSPTGTTRATSALPIQPAFQDLANWLVQQAVADEAQQLHATLDASTEPMPSDEERTRPRL